MELSVFQAVTGTLSCNEEHMRMGTFKAVLQTPLQSEKKQLINWYSSGLPPPFL